MPEIDVAFASGSSTRCVIEPGALARLPALCVASGLRGTAGLVVDARLLQQHRNALPSAFGEPIARPTSEDRKALAEVEAICDALAARGVQRDGFVVAVGGGVLTDLAGFAAAIYLRGVPWVSVPSTLLAQVDAGLGGKTGANLRAGKNLVGAFHQPKLVVCDPELLRTLPEREMWSGLAEVVKCALLEGGELLERCERDLERAAAKDPAALAPLVEGSIRVKARIVAADEREGSTRAHLNLGHTVGHALEAATGYARFAHGEAVALGLRGTLALSRARGLDARDADRATALVGRLRIAADRSLGPGARDAALEAMSKDKKARAGRVRFVLLRSLGAPYVADVDRQECAHALAAALGDG